MNYLIKKIAKVSDASPVKMNKRLITFFICLLVSVIFWLLMTLSKNYTTSVSFPVHYINVPKGKIINGELPNAINIHINSTGYSLLGYKIKPTNETIVMDLKDAKSLTSKNNYYLLTNSKLEKIAAQFGSSVRVVKIDPDSILLAYDNKISKMVPVRLNKEISFEDDYQLTDSILIIPEKVEVSGAVSDIEKIKFVETDLLVIDDIEKSTMVKLKLKKKEEYGTVDFSASDVEVKISVAKYTEASIELPIHIENLPSEFTLKIFPDKVKVKYIVAFEDYDKIHEGDFRLVVNYNTIEKGSSKIKVEMVKFPSFIKSIKLSPEKVEYIIRK